MSLWVGKYEQEYSQYEILVGVGWQNLTMSYTVQLLMTFGACKCSDYGCGFSKIINT